MRFCLFKPAATSASLNVRKRLWHGPESCLVFKQMWNQSIYGRGRSHTLSGWVLHMPASYKHTMRHRRVLSRQRIRWFYPGFFVLCCLEGRVGSQMHCGRCPLAAFPCLNEAICRNPVLTSTHARRQQATGSASLQRNKNSVFTHFWSGH